MVPTGQKLSAEIGILFTAFVGKPAADLQRSGISLPWQYVFLHLCEYVLILF